MSSSAATRPELGSGDARVARDEVRQRLVHAQRRALDVAAHVGDAGKLQQALDRAVLAELAVQNGKHHVHADRLVPPLLEDEQSVGTLRSGDSTAGRQLPVSQCASGPLAQLPGAALRDPDVERLVLVEVEVLGDLLGRLDRDRMFFGTTPEEDGDSQPVHDAPRSKRRQLVRVFSTVSLRAWSV